MPAPAKQPQLKPSLLEAEPQLFVRDIRASVAWFESKLGFAKEFVYGDPPFYAQVKRDGARLNLRLICEPVFVGDVRARESLLACSITVDDVQALYAEYGKAGVDFQQDPQRQPWGARDFVVRDPDGNLILFAGA